MDIIKELCRKNGITVAGLEKTLGFGNGSISKPGKMSARRVYEISRYFNVPMEYIITGKMPSDDNDISTLKRQQALLFEIAKAEIRINEYQQLILQEQDRIEALKSECEKLKKEEK